MSNEYTNYLKSLLKENVSEKELDDIITNEEEEDDIITNEEEDDDIISNPDDTEEDNTEDNLDIDSENDDTEEDNTEDNLDDKSEEEQENIDNKDFSLYVILSFLTNPNEPKSQEALNQINDFIRTKIKPTAETLLMKAANAEEEDNSSNNHMVLFNQVKSYIKSISSEDISQEL